MLIDYDEPLLGHTRTARASGFAMSSFKTGFHRGQLRQSGPQRQGTNTIGMPPRFTLREAMMLAVTNRAWNVGLDLATAFKAGSHFAYAADNAVGDVPKRVPGELYAAPFNVMVVHSLTGKFRFAPLDEDNTIDFTTLFSDPATGQSDTASVSVLNFVERAVFLELGVDVGARKFTNGW